MENPAEWGKLMPISRTIPENYFGIPYAWEWAVNGSQVYGNVS